MRIFLLILLFLILLLTAVLLLRVSVIIGTDKDGKINIKFKILFKTFEDKGDNSDSSVAKSLKETLGLNRLEKENLKKEAKKTSFSDTLSQTLSQITALLKTVFDLIKTCKIKKLYLNVICAEEDAAQTAIAYGRCCALVYPLLGYLHSGFKIRKKGEKVNIYCDYDKKEGSFDFEIVLAFRIFRILSAFLKTAYKESKRKNKGENKS